MDEAVLALLGTLVEVRAELGQTVYEAAIDRARLAVAHECLVEAERRALKARNTHRVVDNVVFIDTTPDRKGAGDERR